MSTLQSIQWNITALSVPEILRHCKGCTKKQIFLSSGLFRINAQKNRLDVWLIHRCQKCGSTWNMDIHSRITPRSLDPDIYQGYLRNDPDLAKYCAFNNNLLQKNRVEARLDNLIFEIDDPMIKPDTLIQPVTVKLLSPHDLNIRVEKLLRQKLELSRSALEKQIKAEKIYCGNLNLMKAKFQTGMEITILN